ncbi:hypothetical protein [Micromonospora chalcea]|uniref:hypothetical protein n=1 Tax=Micromonospora chalcea TaxID=1874 RepID=UPI000CE36837|nr:hypothetical protein [Micromonospora chalcea]PPA57287.1 hypothetical protein BAW75_24890 [Micromonospora chalcea]
MTTSAAATAGVPPTGAANVASPGPVAGTATAPDDGAGPSATPNSNSASATSPPAGSSDPAAELRTPTTLDSQDRSLAPSAPPDGMRRQHNLRRSSQFVIGGDQVGRDKYVVMLGGRERTPLQRLSPMLTNPVRHAFVEPAEWPRMRGACAEKRIVILRGARGAGKTATAIRLLQSPSDRRVFNLDQNVDLQRLGHWLELDGESENPLPSGAGFLLCEPAGWGATRGWMLQQLHVVLDRIDARLVLTVGADAALADQDLMEFVVDLGDPPGHADVLARHLSWRLRTSQEGADAERLSSQMLADPDLLAYTRELFVPGTPLKVAADLALVISQQLDGGAVDVDRLRARMADRLTEDFDIWFGGLPDVPSRCLAIALAVLNGLSYEVVVRAARRLAERLDGPPEGGAGGDRQAPWRDPFGLTRRERERLLRARSRQTDIRSPWGNVRADVLEYVDDGYAQMVLEHVWRQYQIHDELLEWLHDLADDRGSEEVRVWAGTALGLLSTYAFEAVLTRVLRPMALDEQRYWLRDVVAYALRVPAEDARWRPLVENVVAGLYGNPALPVGQATAARIHGVSLGPLNTRAALAALDRLAVIDDFRVANGIGDSLADVLLQDEEHNAPLVLSRISSWLNDRRRNVAGQYVFLWLAKSLRAEAGAGELTGAEAGDRPGAAGPDQSNYWPTLLLLADRHPQLRVVLVDMWQAVLNAGTFSNLTEQALTGWAAMAEADHWVGTAFIRMLTDVAARSDRTRQLIRRLAANWRAVDNLQPHPRTAYAVEAALAPGGSFQ